MARDFALVFYHSMPWRRAQAAYMRKPIDTPFGIVPPYLCERCYEKGQLKPAKVVHHKTFLTPQNINDPFVTLCPDNFMRLCQDCHAAVHSSGNDDADRRVAFDEYGNVIRR